MAMKQVHGNSNEGQIADCVAIFLLLWECTIYGYRELESFENTRTGTQYMEP